MITATAEAIPTLTFAKASFMCRICRVGSVVLFHTGVLRSVSAPNTACTDEVGSQGCHKKKVDQGARERKNSNTSPPLLQGCIKALTRVV